MNRASVALCLLAFCSAPAFAQTTPTDDAARKAFEEALKRTLLQEPVKVVAGYQEGGIGATAKGDYATPFGKFIGNFTPAYTYALDGTWNSETDKRDQVEFSGGIGLVSLNDGFPEWFGIVRLIGKNGQFKEDDALKKANQLLAGIVVEYVPKAWSKRLFDRVAIRAEDFEPCVFMTPEDAANSAVCRLRRQCLDLPVEAYKKRSDCQNVDRCLGMNATERAKHPECKITPGPALEAPPKFTLGYYHPVRTQGDAELPEKIEAGKVTATFNADNVIRMKLPLRIVANLSGTYALNGSDKDFGGKIDVGLGFPSVSEKFTPIIKYVSGEKDGFKYDQALILGLILDFAKTKLPERP